MTYADTGQMHPLDREFILESLREDFKKANEMLEKAKGGKNK